MATGAVFLLITNDGKQDRMLMATALLNKRLKLIEQARFDDPMIKDSTPTLLDIEKTHVLFMNAHFKPFAAIGYEYIKQRPQSGTAVLGSEVTFSIPQFGDFFHDMLVRVKLTAPTIDRTDAILLDADGDQNDHLGGRQHAPAFRWCSFPGERLLQKVSFNVNGNPLDEYTYHSYNFWREFCVTKVKEAGWYRCVGQERPQEGHYRQPGVDLALSASPGSDTGVAWSGVGPDSHRICAGVKTGAQTPKLTPDDLEVYVPLLFWCNLDPRLSVPSVAIPYGQRFINVSLAARSLMYGLVPRGIGTWDAPRGSLTAATNEIAEIELYINNIFVNPEVHDIFIRRIGFSLIRVHREQIVQADKSSHDHLLNAMKWPIETLFVGMRVAGYSDSNSWNLDRWHKFSKWDYQEYDACGIDCTAATNTLSNEPISNADGDMAWNAPATGDAEYLVIRLQGDPFGNSNSWEGLGINIGDSLLVGGHLYKVLRINPDGSSEDTIHLHPPVTGLTQTANTVITANTCLDEVCVSTVPKCVVEAPVCTRTLDKITINAHGIPLYNEFPATFYDSYVPYHFGGPSIQTPDDCGPVMITFNLYPKSYQPSGHINVSRAREFYLKYESSVISSSTLGQLVISASSLNFLLISDGSAVLRYST